MHLSTNFKIVIFSHTRRTKSSEKKKKKEAVINSLLYGFPYDKLRVTV